MDALPFVKMHGLGNDFVVLDARFHRVRLDAAAVRAMAARRTGIGCDQVVIIEPPTTAGADVFMRIYNADGGEVEACGNAARCVAALILRERQAADSTVIDTLGGRLTAGAAGDGIIVDMGAAEFDWRRIPLAEAADPLQLVVPDGPAPTAVAVSIGNPHVVFFVDDVEAIPLSSIGPRIEGLAMFPNRTNVEVAQVLAEDRLRLRVWERGVGITPACGTGACAAAAAAWRRGLTGRAVNVDLDGGRLQITIGADDHLMMIGPAAVSFSGILGEVVRG